MIVSQLKHLKASILYLAGDGNYTHVHFLAYPPRLYATTLGTFANELTEFVRIHKSYLINPDHVIDYRSNGPRMMEVLVGKRWLPISRRRIGEAEILFRMLDEIA